MALSFDCGELDCQAARTWVPEVTGQAIVQNESSPPGGGALAGTAEEIVPRATMRFHTVTV